MTISSYDALTAAIGAAQHLPFYKASMTGQAGGEFHSHWLNPGYPGAAAAPASGVNGEQVTSATAGAMPYTNAAFGKQKYLGGLEAACTTAGMILLLDRLWQNSGLSVTTTTQQTIAPVALPSRDDSGSAVGVGVRAWLEVVTALGLGSAITSGASIKYTNSDAAANRTGTIGRIPAGAVAGTMVPIALQSGDVGVQSVQGVTLGTSLVSGSISLVLARRLAAAPIPAGSGAQSLSFFELGQRLYDGSALQLAQLLSLTLTGVLSGSVSLIEA